MAKTFKLALNAGHGMHTEGKRCMKSLDPSETREWWLNQRVANYVQEAAKQYEGFGVLRTDDVTGAEDVRLSTRCAAANSYGANLYLSLHHNAGINGGRGGGELLFEGTPEELVRYGKGYTAAYLKEVLYGKAKD